MKLVRTEDAVGHVICHDITQIIKGVTKDAVFRKGHVVTEEDIPVLLSVGKENLYVWEKEEGMLHENEAEDLSCLGEGGFCLSCPVCTFPNCVSHRRGSSGAFADRKGMSQPL